MQPKRNRPRISSTIAVNTQAIIAQVAKDLALPNPGVTVDYIVNDWVALKRAHIAAAAPHDHQEQPA
jgi:hypothetical protein